MTKGVRVALAAGAGVRVNDIRARVGVAVRVGVTVGVTVAADKEEANMRKRASIENYNPKSL